MDIQEYFYTKPRIDSDDYEFFCRYCDFKLKDWSLAYDLITDCLVNLEKDMVVHMMGCQKFFKIRKEEIEEEV